MLRASFGKHKDVRYGVEVCYIVMFSSCIYDLVNLAKKVEVKWVLCAMNCIAYSLEESQFSFIPDQI